MTMINLLRPWAGKITMYMELETKTARSTSANSRQCRLYIEVDLDHRPMDMADTTLDL
jgi:hypothetical protein